MNEANNMIVSEVLKELTKRCGTPYTTTKKGRTFFTMAKCPYCGNESEKFEVNLARDLFHCFSCHAGGDAHKLTRDFRIGKTNLTA
jgi:DNA primase